ncbi:MAG: 50S ribosomal protein L4 [Solobacterium sp.]|nr:50S ribosomal protein L4 [Solobacterium sp.]
MTKLNVLNLAGEVTGEIEVSDEVFNREPNQQAMFDAILTYQAGLRQGTHSTKTRAFVSGTGKKPFRQKGTGRARQGSTRATQWRHGAIAFGPHSRKYNLKMNRKVRRLALQSALSEKQQEGSMVVLENLVFGEIKTKKAVEVMDKLSLDRKTLFVASFDEDFDNAYLSFRNIPNALVVTVPELNVYDIVNADKIVFTKTAAERAGEDLI